MASENHNKCVNKTRKQQTHRYRERASGYQWREGRGMIGVEGIFFNRVIKGLYEITSVTLLKIVKHCRIFKSLHSINQQ